MALSAGSIGLDLEINKAGFNKQLSDVDGMAKKAAGKLSSSLNVKNSPNISEGVASVKKATEEIGKQTAKVGKETEKLIDESSQKIQAILEDADKSLKSKAASIAAIYKKQGMSASDAMKTAWSQIERSSAGSTERIQRNINGIKKGFTATADNIQNSFAGSSSAIVGLFKKVALAAAAAFSVYKIAEFGKSCLELGSDLQEVQNVVDVTFPHMTAQIDKFAKDAASQFGLSETMAKKFAGTYGSMAEAFGFTESQAAQMGTTLTGLAGDVASFYNISQDEAYTKLKSVFSGETETLKDLGIVMTQTALDSWALANGFGKTTQKMSEAEKVSLRLAFVQSQLANATGDFARTSDSWANQTRILSLQFDSLKASIGQGLINLFTPIITQINALMQKLVSASALFKQFTALITGKKTDDSGIKNVAKAADSSTTALGKTTGAANSLTKATKKAGAAAKKAAKDMLGIAGFDELNNFTKSDKEKKSDDSGKTGTAGAGASLPISTDTNDVEGANKALEKFRQIIDNIKTALQPTIQALKNLWEAMKPLKDFAVQALLDFYNKFLKPVGSWVLGEGLPRFINALANGLSNIDFAKINKALAGLWDALTPFTINVGKGLLWFWENVLVPLGTWTANEVVPRFLKTLSTVITILNTVIEALKPLATWFWENVLKKIAEFTGGIFLKVWDGINKVLGTFSTWLSNNEGVVRGFTITVGAFFAAWKTITLLSFIQQCGGVVSALGMVAKALLATKLAKIADIAQTVILNAMYAKDFVVNLASSVAALAKQAAAFVASTAAKVADTAAQIAATAATVAWNVACGLATAATTAFGVAISILTSPITLVIAALAALVAAGVAIYKNWDKIKAGAAELWKKIVSVFTPVGAWFKSCFEKAFNNIKNIFSKIGSIFQAAWSGITAVFTGTAEWFKGIFTKAFNNIKIAFSAAKSVFQSVWAAIKDPLTGAAEWFKGIFGKAFNNIKIAFSTAKALFQGVWANIKAAISNPAAYFKQKFVAAFNAVKAAFSAAKSTFQTIWNAIKAPFASVATFFKDKFSDAWEKVKNVFSTGGKIFTGIKEGIASTFKTIVNGLITGINTIVKKPFDVINGMLNTIREVGIGSAKPFKSLWSKNPITIPAIPKLAMGGYVKANTPQLAMIGDNRHQGEVVSPEDKLQQMADTAAGKAGEVTASALIPVIERLCNAIIELENSGGGIVLEGVSDSGLYRIVKNEHAREKKRGVRYGI